MSVSVNDSTIVLNPGVGGDATDASKVVDPLSLVVGDIKRERIVITGDALREAIADLVLVNASWRLPVIDQEARESLSDIKGLLAEILHELKFG